MPKETDHKEAHRFDPEGLVLPRKLPNPNIESREKKDLHKEMLWKMKFGSNDPKDCELQKAYANYANRQRLKEIELEKANRMTFEKLLEEQRQRLHSVGRGEEFVAPTIDEPVEEQTDSPTPTSKNEFLQVFSKVRAKHGTGVIDSGDSTTPVVKPIEARAKAM